MHNGLYKYSGLFILLVFMSCTGTKKTVSEIAPPPMPTPVVQTKINMEDTFFEKLFAQHPGMMDKVLASRKEWNVQIIYTQVDRLNDGTINLTDHFFNRSPGSYFYPASTVKLPVALLALQRLNEINIPGLTMNSSMVTEAVDKGQSAVYHDPNTANGAPSIAQYIKQILLVSDNDAFNRLYEFLGQEYINKSLHEMGYDSAQILHRLSISLTEDENRHTNPVNFYDGNQNLLYAKPAMFNTRAYAKRSDSLGKAFYAGGKLYNGPMDFSKKNQLQLADLHHILTSIIFPAAVAPKSRFKITEADRQFILQYMSMYPSESGYPAYGDAIYDTYVKFLLYGAEKKAPMPRVRIFNKVGDAYGHLIDAAYIVDFENNIEFMVSAVIYCNSNQTLNDDTYDYESIGFPFMKNLGRILYEHELKRKRNFKPDLSSLIFNYRK